MNLTFTDYEQPSLSANNVRLNAQIAVVNRQKAVSFPHRTDHEDLRAWEQGDDGALERLVPLVYAARGGRPGGAMRHAKIMIFADVGGQGPERLEEVLGSAHACTRSTRRGSTPWKTTCRSSSSCSTGRRSQWTSRAAASRRRSQLDQHRGRLRREERRGRPHRCLLRAVTGTGWVRDETRQYCARCPAEFGFFTRRHHCRVCGEVVCDGCSDVRAWVDRPLTERGRARGVERVRVCRTCAPG